MTYEPEPTAFHVLWPLMTDEERLDFVARAWEQAERGECVYVTSSRFCGWYLWDRMSNAY